MKLQWERFGKEVGEIILLSSGFPPLLPFPSWKPDGFQSFQWWKCVCVRMRACVRMCLAMSNGLQKGKKSSRHFSYRCRQIWSENTQFIFLAYFVSSFSHIAHCCGHQKETFCQLWLVKGLSLCNAVRNHLKFLSAATQVGIAQSVLVIFLYQKVTYPIQVWHTVWRRNDFCTYPIHLLECNLRRDLL